MDRHNLELLLACPLLLFLLWKYIERTPKGIRGLPIAPSKEASWIWGHEYEIFRHEAYKMYTKWTMSLAPMYRLRAALFSPDIIVACDNVAVQHIFQNPYIYVKSPAYRPMVNKLIGRGLVWAEGEEHKHQRRLLAPAFTLNAVKGMADDVFSCTDKMIQRLRTQLENGDNTTVNIIPLTSACTLDIIGRVAFGHDFGNGESPEAKAINWAWHQDVVLGHTFGGFLAPILINHFPWIARLPIPALQTDGVAKQIVLKLAGELLKEYRANPNTTGRDMMSLLVNDNQGKGKNEATLDDSRLLENILTFIMVGHETTAGTVDHTLFALARNASVQEKLRQEIRRAGDHLDYETISKLEYLDAVVREGLRLYPAGPPTGRVALEDDVIPLRRPIHTPSGEVMTSISIEAGQVFYIPWAVLNTNTQVWGDSAHVFKPERWLEPGGVPPADALPHGPWIGVSSFCDGPRGCIGWRLGVLELKVMIAMLIRSFEFKTTGAKISHYISPTLQPFADGVASLLHFDVSAVPEGSYKA